MHIPDPTREGEKSRIASNSEKEVEKWERGREKLKREDEKERGRERQRGRERGGGRERERSSVYTEGNPEKFHNSLP